MRKNNSQLRIISGELGGRLIDAPNTPATHPMGDRERQAIFNQIRAEVPGAKALDAFAGSGALGIEALSLGAASVDFLENNPKAIRTINDNIAKLNLGTKTQVIRTPKAHYDLIFANPPYDKPQYKLVEELVAHLSSNGIFVLSHPNLPQPPDFVGLALISDRNYAAACIKIYRKI